MLQNREPTWTNPAAPAKFIYAYLTYWLREVLFKATKLASVSYSWPNATYAWFVMCSDVRFSDVSPPPNKKKIGQKKWSCKKSNMGCIWCSRCQVSQSHFLNLMAFNRRGHRLLRYCCLAWQRCWLHHHVATWAARLGRAHLALWLGWCLANSWLGWWIQPCFIFIPTWGNDPILLIFFRWVETTTRDAFQQLIHDSDMIPTLCLRRHSQTRNFQKKAILFWFLEKNQL